MKILLCHPNACGDMYPLAISLKSLGHQVVMLQEARRKNTNKYPTLIRKLYGACRLFSARRHSDYFAQKDDGLETIWFDPSTGLEKLITFPIDRMFRMSPYRGNFAHRMWMIRVAVKRFKPDVILSCDGFHYGVPAALLKRLGALECALVVQFIGGDALDEPMADCGVRRTKVSCWMYRQVLLHATLVRPFSPMLKTILLQELHVPEKLRVVPGNLAALPQTALDQICSERDLIKRELCRLYSIPDQALIVMSLSNNQQGKGIQYLAEAWPHIHKKFPECYWMLVGPDSPWFAKELKPALIGRPGIKIVGKVQGMEVFRYLAVADLLVNPTLADGLNLVTAEAAAVGTPSIVTTKAGIADWVLKHGTGMTVPAYDIAELTSAVEEFFQMSDVSRQEMRRRCREMASNFSVDTVAKRLLEVFEEAVTLNSTRYP